MTAHVVAGPKGTPVGVGMFSASITDLNISAATATLEKSLQPNEASNITLTLSVPSRMVRLWWPNGVAQATAVHNISFIPHEKYDGRQRLGVFVASKKIGFRTLAIVTNDDSKPSRIVNLSGSGSLVLRTS